MISQEKPKLTFQFLNESTMQLADYKMTINKAEVKVTDGVKTQLKAKPVDVPLKISSYGEGEEKKDLHLGNFDIAYVADHSQGP